MFRSYFLLLLFCILGVAPVAAQSKKSGGKEFWDLYPIRVNHKTGYLRITKYAIDTFIPPRYDYIGDVNLPWHTTALADAGLSPYRIFERDNKVGLLNTTLKEVLSNDFNRIRALHPNYFAVEKAQGFQLIDQQGQVHLGGTYFDDIALAQQISDPDPVYFFVKKGAHWGIAMRSGTIVISPQYADIETAGALGYFKVRREPTQSGWQLIDTSSQPVFAQAFTDIRAIDRGFFAVLDKGWYFRWSTTAGKPATSGEERYRDISKVNDYLVVADRSEGGMDVWSIAQRKKMKQFPAVDIPHELRSQIANPAVPEIYPGNNAYAIFTSASVYPNSRSIHSYSRLLDSVANFASPAFGTIRPAAIPNVFLAERNDKWGLMAPERSGEPFVQCQYDSIQPFRKGIAICRQGGGFGLLVVTPQSRDSLPCVYDQITQNDTTFLLEFEENTVRYNFDPASGTLQQDPGFFEEGSRLMPEMAEKKGKEALAVRIGEIKQDIDPQKQRFIRYENNNDGPDYTFIRVRVQESESGAKERIETELVDIPLARSPNRVTEILPDTILLLEYDVLYRKPAKEKRTRLHFYHLVKNQFIDTVEVIEILPFLQEDHYTIFKDQPKVFPNGKAYDQYGLIDRYGQQCLSETGEPLRFTNIRRYQDFDFYQVEMRATPTFSFNKRGQEIFVNPTKLRPFSEGLSVFRNSGANSLWGYVNAAGDTAIAPRFKIARPFSEGLAMVVDSTGLCAFIDSTGRKVFSTSINGRGNRHLRVGDFHGGRCWFKTEGRRWFWGAFDKTGEVVIPPRYYYKLPITNKQFPGDPYFLPMDFSAGVASVMVRDSTGLTRWAIIDEQGDFLLPPTDIDSIGSFNVWGRAVFAAEKGGRQGLMNKDGRPVLPPTYKKIEPFVMGYAKVKSEAGSWGLINLDGREILPPQYEEIDTLSEGLIGVKPYEQSWYFADTLGRTVIEGPFDTIRQFANGVAMVTEWGKNILVDRSGARIELKEGKLVFFSQGILGVEDVVHNSTKSKEEPDHFFYADATGNNLFGRYFEEIEPFQQGVAKVRRLPLGGGSRVKEFLGAINPRGVMIVPPKYRNLHVQPDGNIITNPQRFVGLINKTGKLVVTTDYDRIQPFKQEGLFRVERGESVGYIRITDDEMKWVWPLQQ